MKKIFGLLAVLLCFGSMAFAAAQPFQTDSDDSQAVLCNSGSIDSSVTVVGLEFVSFIAFTDNVMVVKWLETDVLNGYGNLIDQPPVATLETLEDPIDPGRWC